MTKIKTATANYMHGDGLLNVRGWPEDERRDLQVVIVHGLTEAEVHEAAALLEKSREVCEWERDCFGRLCDCEGESHSTSKHSNGAIVKYCPSCGRRVVVVK